MRSVIASLLTLVVLAQAFSAKAQDVLADGCEYMSVGQSVPAPVDRVVGDADELLSAAFFADPDVATIVAWFGSRGFEAGTLAGIKEDSLEYAALTLVGPEGSTAGVVYAPYGDGAAVVGGRFQEPVPETAYRTVTDVWVSNSSVMVGAGVMMNGGGGGCSPPNPCYVPQTCGGFTDWVCVYWCTVACAPVPAPARYACLAACPAICWVPTYQCGYCAPCS